MKLSIVSKQQSRFVVNGKNRREFLTFSIFEFVLFTLNPLEHAQTLVGSQQKPQNIYQYKQLAVSPV